MNDSKHFEYIEAKLSTLINGAELPEETKKQIQSYVDVDEFGVALEIFCDMIRDNGLEKTRYIESIRDLAKRMKMEKSNHITSILLSYK